MIDVMARRARHRKYANFYRDANLGKK